MGFGDKHVRDSDGETVSVEEAIIESYDKTNRSIRTGVTLEGDLEIGAVELKDATTATRMALNAANTARTTGTIVIPSQHVGANGSSMPSGASVSDPIHVSTGGAVASVIGDGRQVVTTPGTAVALAGSTVIKEVTITSELNNTGTITVGGSTVVDAEATRRGTPLYPGDSFTLKSDNLSEIFIDAEIGTDGVSFSYLS